MGKLKNGKAAGTDEVTGEMIKIYAGILVGRVCRVTEGLTDDEQGGFRVGRKCIDQIFTLKQKGEEAREKNCSVCGFYGFGEGI